MLMDLSREPMVVNDISSSDNDIIDDDDSDIVLDDIVIKKVGKSFCLGSGRIRVSILIIIRWLRVQVTNLSAAWLPTVYPFCLQILQM